MSILGKESEKEKIIYIYIKRDNNFAVELKHCKSIMLSAILLQSSSVQSLSHVWLFSTPWTTARQAFLSITNSRSLLKLMAIESVMPSNHLIFCHPLLLLPSFFPSIRVFSNESALCIRWPNIGVSALASILPKNTQDWSPLEWIVWLSLPSKGLKSFLQHHSSKASILWHSAFFII